MSNLTWKRVLEKFGHLVGERESGEAPTLENKCFALSFSTMGGIDPFQEDGSRKIVMKAMKQKPIEQRFLVIDDHEAILEGTLPALQEKYPTANIMTAGDRHHAEQLIDTYYPELVTIDLSIPAKPNTHASPDVGLSLVKKLLLSSFAPNILVLSTDIKPLIRLKSTIDAYEGGFAAMDKSSPIQEMLRVVELALRGSIYLPPQVRSRPEFDRRWLMLLQLKFQEGLTDKAIAKRMKISDRTIRNYWIRIQDTLEIFDHPDKDVRVQIEIEARKMGLIN